MPSVTIRRKVGWADTDASGYYLFTTVFRWFMEAEAELFLQLGLDRNTYGHLPRVHVEADYKHRLWFLDEVEFELRVDRVGRSSVRYGFTVRKDQVVAATGSVTAVYLPEGAERAQPWPPEVRQRLGGGSVTG